ncbi:hypothetical protein ACWEO1_15920 [Kitasatospora cineracea]
MRAALPALEAAGHRVVDTALPPPAEEPAGAFTALWNTGAAGVPLTDPGRVEPHDRALRDAAPAVDSWAYARRTC